MKIPQKFVDAPCAYTSFNDVPEGKRLCQYSNEFEGRDVWADFYTSQIKEQGYSQSYKWRVQRCGELWKDVCQEYGRHHALASPDIVKMWCQDLLEGRTKGTVRKSYFLHINRFYIYLMWNTNYPHMYNPVQFAIKENPEVAEMWWRYRI